MGEDMRDAQRTISEHLDTCDRDDCCLDEHRDEIERLQKMLAEVLAELGPEPGRE